jgi:hypothetical protein
MDWTSRLRPSAPMSITRRDAGATNNRHTTGRLAAIGRPVPDPLSLAGRCRACSNCAASSLPPADRAAKLDAPKTPLLGTASTDRSWGCCRPWHALGRSPLARPKQLRPRRLSSKGISRQQWSRVFHVPVMLETICMFRAQRPNQHCSKLAQMRASKHKFETAHCAITSTPYLQTVTFRQEIKKCRTRLCFALQLFSAAALQHRRQHGTLAPAMTLQRTTT